jgi:hypothetical protein
MLCRPFGALLDNVANGYAYRTVDWQDVTSRGLIKALQVGSCSVCMLRSSIFHCYCYMVRIHLTL